MITIPTWLTCAIFLFLVVCFGSLMLMTADSSSKSNKESEVSISGENGIVTIRKVGRSTSVVIHSDTGDYWEGSDGISIPMTPIEATRRHEPELYAEYMSEKTSAIRKYEIAEELYSIGYTLPYQRGLHEQWVKEMRLMEKEPAPEDSVPIDLDVIEIPQEAEQ